MFPPFKNGNLRAFTMNKLRTVVCSQLKMDFHPFSIPSQVFSPFSADLFKKWFFLFLRTNTHTHTHTFSLVVCVCSLGIIFQWTGVILRRGTLHNTDKGRKWRDRNANCNVCVSAYHKKQAEAEDADAYHLVIYKMCVWGHHANWNGSEERCNSFSLLKSYELVEYYFVYRVTRWDESVLVAASQQNTV